ncbi:hypothetical protein [Pseudoduganella buxea]|uniref:Uncharacterized protein n=1 Tax=Pseudoduganella buxea TaxID=1949069 RepID=A0A6I3T1X0_9BURK|nr:hypothetical protein [Pseudoduganella buxea]MTV54746.1 hypothetical protein [Pseudoduganella buxea]GGC22403.1 hypothetical protein GCM10011572_49860 [Pseudoduganella buxea]
MTIVEVVMDMMQDITHITHFQLVKNTSDLDYFIKEQEILFNQRGRVFHLPDDKPVWIALAEHGYEFRVYYLPGMYVDYFVPFHDINRYPIGQAINLQLLRVNR